MPGKRRTCWPSLSSQAAVTAKQGFRNSLGCTVMPGRLIQRRAPLISTPFSSVSTVSIRATPQPRIARRRTLRGDSREMPITTSPASARNTTCFRMNASRETWMRSATEGDADSIIT